MLPSCVSFRDQELAGDFRRVRYNGWTELETYIHNVAAKDAIRQTMDSFEEYVSDGLTMAKELYRRGVISRHSVDMADGAQFADIPSYKHRETSFFTSMYRAIDNSFQNWFHFIEVLRSYPNVNERTDDLIKTYEDLMAEMELEKYKVDPPLASSDEAKVMFEELCDEFEGLWDDAIAKLREQDLKDLKSHLRYTYLDKKDQLETMESHDEVFQLMRSRVDMMNISIIESLVGDYQWWDFHRKFQLFARRRAIKCSHIRLRDFAHQMKVNPKFRQLNFNSGQTFQLSVNWDKENTSMFRYFWLMEIVFSSLSKHQFLNEIDYNSENFFFHFCTPEWVISAIAKISREKTIPLVLNGVCFAGVLDEITIPNPAWGLTKEDEFDYMTSIVRITQGGVDGVLDTLDGCNPRKQWESMDVDRRFLSYDTLMDDFPKAIPWLPQTIVMNNFFFYHETNHVWISHPFYTGMKGFKFALIVYAKGKGSGKGTYLSVGVCLMAGEQDDILPFPVRGKLIVRLVNQLGDHSHLEGQYVFNDETRSEICDCVVKGADFAPIGLSLDEFITFAGLEYSSQRGTQYLINDCLYFQMIGVNFVHRRPRNYNF